MMISSEALSVALSFALADPSAWYWGRRDCSAAITVDRLSEVAELLEKRSIPRDVEKCDLPVMRR